MLVSSYKLYCNENNHFYFSFLNLGMNFGISNISNVKE